MILDDDGKTQFEFYMKVYQLFLIVNYLIKAKLYARI